jgi:diadenosine tetraphosphate (Ap4A) HIT family hydrolase
MSPLTVGHLLLLPRVHYFCFSALLRTHLDELTGLLDMLRPLYAATFGELLVLEHGSAQDSTFNACVTHAHWHFVPVDGTKVDALMQRDALPRVELTDLADLGGPQWQGRPYYYTAYAGEHHVYEPWPGGKRQYLRSLIGQVLSISDPEWDYAVVVRKELLRETMDRVRSWPRLICPSPLRRTEEK